MTGGDVITSALRKIGATASGETPSGSEMNDGLTLLNDMMDSFSAERLMIFSIVMNEFPLVPGQQTYTLGTGGNFNIGRPPRIERQSIVNLNNPAQPLELPLHQATLSEWQAVPVKLINSTLPQLVYDDNAFPLRNQNFWCVPTVTVKTRIYSWTVLTQFADLVTNYTFPPGYAECLKWQLAIRWAAEFGRQLDASVALLAIEAKARIKSLNSNLPLVSCEAVLVNPRARTYNWLTDLPAGHL